MSSHKQINFSIRPAKSIQRKMLCEAFTRLAPFARVSSYSYIGFGGYFFSDFSLVHRTLDIRRMTSIEQETGDIERFEYNRPYKCITVEPGPSGDVLPTLSWRNKAIVWLDYDKRLCDEFLADIRHVCSNAAPGTILVVTVDADSKKLEQPRDALSKIDPKKIPADVKDSDLSGWGLANIYWHIIRNEIHEQASIRGRTLSPSKKLKYRQLFNFHYSDGTKMLTTGGLLHRNSQSDKVDQCDFEELTFVKTDSDAFLIDVPNLTLKEARSLQSQLPRTAKQRLTTPIPHDDVRRFSEVYRYFPTFVEAEI